VRHRLWWEDNIKVDLTQERDAVCCDLGHKASVSANDGAFHKQLNVCHFVKECAV
jgi:hypothetical protein